MRNLIRVFEQRTLSDRNRGIYQIETQAFGQPPNVDNDDRIYILLLDIPDRFRLQGEFIGGCDIVKEMFEKKELQDKFAEKKIPYKN